jgi:hypothetical protein
MKYESKSLAIHTGTYDFIQSTKQDQDPRRASETRLELVDTFCFMVLQVVDLLLRVPTGTYSQYIQSNSQQDQQEGVKQFRIEWTLSVDVHGVPTGTYSPYSSPTASGTRKV